MRWGWIADPRMHLIAVAVVVGTLWGNPKAADVFDQVEIQTGKAIESLHITAAQVLPGIEPPPAEDERDVWKMARDQPRDRWDQPLPGESR